MTTPFPNPVITAMAALMLSACTSQSMPPPQTPTTAPVATTPANPKDNPFAGTVYESQGDALKKARGVQDTLDQSAKNRLDEIDKNQ